MDFMQTTRRALAPGGGCRRGGADQPGRARHQQPTPAALAAAKEIVSVTGATALFNPLIAGVVEQAKNLFLQQNPGLSKDLNEVAAKMRTDLAPRFDELSNEVARIYAVHFTEAELKELAAFYKTPVGKKLDGSAAAGRRRQPEIRAGLGQQVVGRGDRQDARRNEEERARALIGPRRTFGSAHPGRVNDRRWLTTTSISSS